MNLIDLDFLLDLAEQQAQLVLIGLHQQLLPNWVLIDAQGTFSNLRDALAERFASVRRALVRRRGLENQERLRNKTSPRRSCAAVWIGRSELKKLIF